MKLKMKWVAAFLAAVTVISGCGNSKKENIKDETKTVNRNLQFESYTFDMIAERTDSDTVGIPGEKYIRYSGQGMLPVDIGDAAVKSLRDSLLRMVRVRFEEESGPSPMLSDGERLTDLPPLDSDACGIMYSSLSLTLATPAVMVWEGYREGYACGAAHGNRAASFVNYSVESGKILSLASLMKPNYEKPLVKMIREKIDDMDTDLLVKLNEVEISDQFKITSTGIVFSYDPYMIAPFSEGIVQVKIPTGDLMDLLSDDGVYYLTGQRPAKEE